MARLILIADDSPTIQRKAQRILQDEGFEVETVSNGVAAIKKLPTLQPVLVLADVSMPGKDGYEVCEFVKASADLLHVPVLLVSSDLEPYDEERGAQVRADGIIKKPFTPQDLIAMVAKFTSLGEAPASPSALPGTLVASSPAELPEVPPVGPGLEPSARSQEQDLAALLAGSTFAGRPLDEMPATQPEPLPDVSVQPSPELVLQASPQSLPEPQLAATPEDVLGGSPESSLAPTEPFPDFAVGLTPEPTAEPIPEAAPEAALVGPELISETALEAMPEPVWASPELISEPPPEATPEQVWVMPEPVAESGLPFTSEPVTETAHLPAEAAPETPPAVPLEEVPPPTEPILAEGQAYVAPPATAAGPAPEGEVTRPSAAAAGAPSVIDPEWVHLVVHKVVTKMAPPLLPPELVQELVRILTEEITADLPGPSPHRDARGPAGP